MLHICLLFPWCPTPTTFTLRSRKFSWPLGASPTSKDDNHHARWAFTRCIRCNIVWYNRYVHILTAMSLGLTYVIAVDLWKWAIFIIPSPVHVDLVPVRADGVSVATARDRGTTVRFDVEVHLFGRRCQVNTGLALCMNTQCVHTHVHTQSWCWSGNVLPYRYN